MLITDEYPGLREAIDDAIRQANQERGGSAAAARDATLFHSRWVEGAYRLIDGKWAFDGDAARGFATSQQQEAVRLAAIAEYPLMKQYAKTSPEYAFLNRDYQALFALMTMVEPGLAGAATEAQRLSSQGASGAQVPLLGRPWEEYEDELNKAAELDDPEEWDRTVIDLLTEAEIDDLSIPLPPNTEYLVMSVAGYILDMTRGLPYNCFEEWMAEGSPAMVPSYLSTVRSYAAQVSGVTSPWHGLTIMRALGVVFASGRYIAGEQPDWLEGETRRYSEEARRSRGP